MTTAFIVPLVADNQQVRVTLGGATYRLTVRWNGQPDAGWFVNIADDNGGEILNGMALVTGCDLLGQYKYLGIVGQMTVQTTDNPDAVPTFENLGVSSFLYWVN